MCCKSQTNTREYFDCEKVQNYTTNEEPFCVINISAQICQNHNATAVCTKNFLVDNATCLQECPCGYETIHGTFCQKLTEISETTPQPNTTTSPPCTDTMYMYKGKCEKLCAPPGFAFHLYEFDSDNQCTSDFHLHFILLLACPLGTMLLVVVIVTAVCMKKRGLCCECQCICSCPTRDDESLDNKHLNPLPDVSSHRITVLRICRESPLTCQMGGVNRGHTNPCHLNLYQLFMTYVAMIWLFY